MGRKIPAKKHRGVKDPLKQQAQRLKSLKGKINAPPKDPDDQPIPKSFIELFKFQNKDNHNEKKSRNIKQSKKKPQDTNKSGGKKGKAGNNPISRLRLLPGESPRAFSLRINSAVRALHHPIENHNYPLDDMEEEDHKGSRMLAQRERRERKRLRAAREAKRAAAAGDSHAAQPCVEPVPDTKLTRHQRYNNKKKEKNIKRAEARAEAAGGGGGGVMYERVLFGDIAHAPPALPVKPRHAADADGAPRPGTRNLLLSQLLFGNSESGQGSGRGLTEAQRLRNQRIHDQIHKMYQVTNGDEGDERKL